MPTLKQLRQIPEIVISITLHLCCFPKKLKNSEFTKLPGVSL